MRGALRQVVSEPAELLRINFSDAAICSGWKSFFAKEIVPEKNRLRHCVRNDGKIVIIDKFNKRNKAN